MSRPPALMYLPPVDVDVIVAVIVVIVHVLCSFFLLSHLCPINERGCHLMSHPPAHFNVLPVVVGLLGFFFGFLRSRLTSG